MASKYLPFNLRPPVPMTELLLRSINLVASRRLHLNGLAGPPLGPQMSAGAKCTWEISSSCKATPQGTMSSPTRLSSLLEDPPLLPTFSRANVPCTHPPFDAPPSTRAFRSAGPDGVQGMFTWQRCGPNAYDVSVSAPNSFPFSLSEGSGK